MDGVQEVLEGNNKDGRGEKLRVKPCRSLEFYLLLAASFRGGNVVRQVERKHFKIG